MLAGKGGPMKERLDTQNLSRFLEALGATEVPLGMRHSARLPDDAATRKGKGHRCVVCRLNLARRTRRPVAFSRSTGCAGGDFFLGLDKPLPDFLPDYISGGERYAAGAEAARAFYLECEPPPARERYLVFQRLDAMDDAAGACELVAFFARPVVVSGLHQLAFFVTDDTQAVASPFGSGCANLVAWVYHYMGQGRLKAVLGGWDPSCRPCLGVEEITFAMPWEMFRRMLAVWEDTFLTTGSWARVRRKAGESG